jgi:hypothetical protein
VGVRAVGGLALQGLFYVVGGLLAGLDVFLPAVSSLGNITILVGAFVLGLHPRG